MAVRDVVQRAAWTQQPQVATPLNTEYSAGLASVLCPSLGYADRGAENGLFSSVAPAVGKFGVSRYAASGGGGIIRTPGLSFAAGDGFSILCCASEFNTGGSVPAAFRSNAGTDNFLIFQSGVPWVRWNGATLSQSVGTAIPNGGSSTFALSVESAANVTYVRDGILGFSTAHAVATGAFSFDTFASQGGDVLSGNYALIAVWKRKLSFSELQKLTANPWRLFAPLSRRIWASSAVGIPTLSLPTYTPGSLTSVGFRPRVTAS